MANRLRDSTSPYLRQHADNPVDWWPWEDGAFAEARRRDVPILLSVGYAACHWCHVMAHESFEDDEVARLLNAAFVPVKVDREERPDIDAVYMNATTALTGHGGWPMTCVLTPDGEPFYAGTYFPRDAFLQLLAAIAQAWRGRREEVVDSAGRITGALRQLQDRPPGGTDGVAIDQGVCDAAESTIADDYDRVRGGFGGAPKFPASMVLEWLLRHHARTGTPHSQARTGTPRALHMVGHTCEAMARGGMYDQVAGGFARYSVDADWVVPHFEKMLYDNAQLLAVYAHLHRATGSALAARVAGETADFLLAELLTPEGAFASSLDADTVIDGHGVEGATYVWTPQQLAEALGPRDGAAAAALLEVTERGTFEHGTSTLQLRRDPDDPRWWADVRARLAAARARRPQPGRDDKVVTSWNGLAVGALAEAGVLLDRPDLVAAAQRCAGHVLGVHVGDGRLARASRDGVVGVAHGVADDYGNLAAGLLGLHQADGDPRWLTAAGDLLDQALARFAHPDGGFYDTDATDLPLRPRSVADNAEPCGQSSLAGALLTFGAATGSPRHLDAARRALAEGRPVAEAQPRFTGWFLAVAKAALAGPLQVAVVGDPPQAAGELLAVARRSTSPGLVLAHGRPDAPGVPLLAGRPLVDGRPAAYVCRGFVCDRPVTTPDELDAALSSP